MCEVSNVWLLTWMSESKPALTTALKRYREKAESASLEKKEVFAFSLCLNKYLESLVCSASFSVPIVRLSWSSLPLRVCRCSMPRGGTDFQ